MRTGNAEQPLIEDHPTMFGTMPLNSKNKWTRMAKWLPWEELESQRTTRLQSPKEQPAYPVRMALGSLLVKEWYDLSDEDVVAEIRMNPYLQYFLGFSEYSYAAPFCASMLTRFRQQITLEMLEWVRDIVQKRASGRESL